MVVEWSEVPGTDLFVYVWVTDLPEVEQKVDTAHIEVQQQAAVRTTGVDYVHTHTCDL